MTIAAPTIALDNRFASELPELAVPWQAADVPTPKVLAVNAELAVRLGIDPAFLGTHDGARLLSGNHLPAGATPVAQAYAGHQFGGYSPRLGDGRALLLGELTDSEGNLVDLHLKGSGRTPFSRGGDGLAAVGPMLREYLISEAMHALGIPTTRSLAVVATGQEVRREEMLPGAVLARVANSHLRVGSFQFARATEDDELLRRLANHAIARHYPHAAESDQPYLELFRNVVNAQAKLVAQWMLAGFVHGVMNTDNMTISGETIDYGPCAFMDDFNPAALYSSIDTGGRYAYSNQPLAAEWNLARLAESLLPLLHEDQDQAVELALEVLGTFQGAYAAAWGSGMRAKLGLADVPAGQPDSEVEALVEEVLAILKDGPVDYTQFFRALNRAARGEPGPVRGMVVDLARFDAWLLRWQAMNPDRDVMARVNPVYIPRNHLVEAALSAATNGDMELFNDLVAAVVDPFTERPGLERFAAGPPQDFGAYRTFCGT
ncbi:hypothetical protein PSET11_03331 [Arthrobacter ulcerisalmonis]|uniref:Protein nucleotidyltransferase YdiU n=1 Tax=Arthrobacter ulcerisalmonis TaxID=2483813 RepID=A0A3P5XF50_9MICC|nr:YdiU family protein [Arthrobacter ulcerisalmonis]VDC33372.1 hypothetical protein PSET11_03331 [Arthrobacter ulcerisalmonis]